MELLTVLIKYLETHKRIVVPQLGAFLVKEPGKSIVFSELMKRDDGVLRGLLMADGRSEVEAAGAVDRFVFEVRHAVESGTEYRLADFGTMMPGPNGTIHFNYRPVVPFDRPARPAEPIPAPSVVRQTPPVPKPVAKPVPEPLADEAPSSAMKSAPRAEAHSVQPVEPEPSYKSHIDTARMAETMRMAFSSEPDEADALTKKGSASTKKDSASAKRPARSYDYEADEAADELYSERRPARRKFDRFLFLAILAAVIAVAAIAFGFWREARERQAEEALQQMEQTDYPT